MVLPAVMHAWQTRIVVCMRLHRSVDNKSDIESLERDAKAALAAAATAEQAREEMETELKSHRQKNEALMQKLLAEQRKTCFHPRRIPGVKPGASRLCVYPAHMRYLCDRVAVSCATTTIMMTPTWSLLSQV